MSLMGVFLGDSPAADRWDGLDALLRLRAILTIEGMIGEPLRNDLLDSVETIEDVWW